jgi:hypothetical protein
MATLSCGHDSVGKLSGFWTGCWVVIAVLMTLRLRILINHFSNEVMILVVEMFCLGESEIFARGLKASI